MELSVKSKAMMAGWFSSSATFKKGTAEKLVFVSLGVLDLALTVAAVNLGLFELNPLVRLFLQMPLLLLVIKLVIPLLIAWLMPGKLLIPSIALLGLVVGWNIRELAVYCL